MHRNVQVTFDFLGLFYLFDRGDTFTFDVGPNGIFVWSKSKGKLSPRSYSLQFEKEYKSIFLRVSPAETLSKHILETPLEIYSGKASGNRIILPIKAIDIISLMCIKQFSHFQTLSQSGACRDKSCMKSCTR